MTVVLGIPTLNRFDLLDRCVESALAGTVRPNLVAIVDNSGGQCLRRPGCSYLVPPSNIGVAAAWNRIADSVFLGADNQLILSNDDIVFAPDTIARLLDVAESSPRAGIVSAILGARFALFWLSREAYRTVGMFDSGFWPAYFEDNDYHRRLTLAGWSADVALSDVRHGGSSTMQRYTPAQLEAHHQQFSRNRSRYAAKWGGPPGEEVFTTPFGL